MRSPDKRFGLKLSFSTAVAVVALVAVGTTAHAQRGGNMSMGGRGPMVGSSGIGSGLHPGVGAGMGLGTGIRGMEPRTGSFNTMSSDGLISRGFKGTGKGTGVSTTEDGPGRPGRRPPHGKRPPRGPILDPGIGTGVLIDPVGPIGPANAGPPPSSPRRNASSGAPAPRAAINIPPNNEQRFVKDEVVLEFAGVVSPQRSGAIAARYRLRRLESAYFVLTNTTYFRWQIPDPNRRSVRTVLRQLAREGAIVSGQPNYFYDASQQAGAEPPAASFTPPADATPKPTPVMATAALKSSL